MVGKKTRKPAGTSFVLAATAAAALLARYVAGVEFWNGLTGKFALSGDGGLFALPTTLKEARASGWLRPPEERDSDLRVRCYRRDPTVCLAYATKGSVAVIQFGIEASYVTNYLQYYEKSPVFEKYTRFGLVLFVVNIYIVDQETIKSGGVDSLRGGIGTGLQFKSKNGFINISLDESTLSKTKPLVKTKCIPRMGDHYYFDIHEVSCDDYVPFFILTKGSKVIGCGVQAFGKPRVIGPRNWNEPIPVDKLKEAIEASQCIAESWDRYGLISTHFYFLSPEKVKLITCPAV